jgi:translation elongation factor EF-1alpha
VEFLAYKFRVDEVAESSPLTFALGVLPALSFAEISHRAKFSVNLLPIVQFALHCHQTSLSLLFFCKFDIHIPNHMVANIISCNYVKNFTVFLKLFKNFLVKIFEVIGSFGEFFIRDFEAICIGNCSSWILVEVKEE